MLGIDKICDTINNLFGKVRPPMPQISRLLLVCSMIKRPGLSSINSLGNIVHDMNVLGIPTGKMPDGSDNKAVAYTYSILKEVYRALKFDASVQVGLQPGSLTSTGVGANAGGPVTVLSTITNPGVGFAQIN